MSEEQPDEVQAAVDGVLKFAEELEASGDVATGGNRLEHARAALHQWVDTVTGVVAVPAFGRVTLIHENGRQSTISSNELPFVMSVPVNWKQES